MGSENPLKATIVAALAIAVVVWTTIGPPHQTTTTTRLAGKP